MGYVIGFLAGALWGALGACLNHLCLGKALRQGDRKVLGANLLRVLIDLALLAAVVLARNVLPFPYEMALAGTVSALGLLGICFAFRTASGQDDKKE